MLSSYLRCNGLNSRLILRQFKGVSTRLASSVASTPPTLEPITKALGEGIIGGRRDALARSITLIESTRFDHRIQAQLLLDYLTTQTSSTSASRYSQGFTLRLGVAGPPGAGKSSFIEKLGMMFVEQGHRVAVIPVDPSSHISGGSILGDKTRMEQLSASESAYVRASPTRGVLGGIAEHTSDIITLCEAASYDVVVVESVGLGQSEVDIDNAVDMLLVIVPPGGGDSLQASKKGIMEAADAVIVNKADGGLLVAAKHTKSDYAGAMHFIRQKYHDWRTPVLMMSVKTGLGVDEVQNTISRFHELAIRTKSLQRKRLMQRRHWMRGHFRRSLIDLAEKDPTIQSLLGECDDYLDRGSTPRAEAKKLLDVFLQQLRR